MFKNNEESARHNKNIETIIGPSVKVEGDFAGDGDVIVEGIVIGTLKTMHHLRIGTDAKVQAEVSADSVYVAGEITGNITAQTEIEIKGAAKINGDIFTSLLSIEKGAIINGKISMSMQNANAGKIKERKNGELE